jgi:ketosteroid isomerase-like protein
MEHEQTLRSLYDSFNARDVDTVLAATAEDIDWPNAWEGGRVRGHHAVREYWRRQWAEIDPHVQPLAITKRPDGQLAVAVRQAVRSREGVVLSEHEVVHTYEMRDGLVARMTVEEPPAE